MQTRCAVTVPSHVVSKWLCRIDAAELNDLKSRFLYLTLTRPGTPAAKGGAMKPIIALTGFEQRLPKQQFEQELSLRRIAEVHSLNGDVTTEQMTVLLKRYGVKAEQISRRYCEDITIAEKGEGILARAEFFSQRGREIVSSFYSDTALAPGHLIHVTCTGYVSPSAVQHLVTDRSWRGTGVTHAYHMGCYAALPAVRIAEGLVASRNRHVDIIHTEMCALHMDRTQHSPEQLVVQSLFADGHIKYSAVPAEAARSGSSSFTPSTAIASLSLSLSGLWKSL